MEKEMVSVTKLILTALAGAIWAAAAFLAFLARYYISNPTVFVLILICTIVWTTAFFVNLHGYLKKRHR